MCVCVRVGDCLRERERVSVCGVRRTCVKVRVCGRQSLSVCVSAAWLCVYLAMCVVMKWRYVFVCESSVSVSS